MTSKLFFSHRSLKSCHQRLEPRRLPVALGNPHDAPLDDGPVEAEVALVRLVVGGDLLLGEGRVDAAVDIVLVELADEQRLAVLLDHPVDVVRRGREEDVGLLQLELLAHPAVDVDLHEGGAVVARKALRHHRLHVAQPQFAIADAREHRIARKITGQLPATRQEQHAAARRRYFHPQSHGSTDKDKVFTCKNAAPGPIITPPRDFSRRAATCAACARS